MERVRPKFGEPGNQVYLVPSNFSGVVVPMLSGFTYRKKRPLNGSSITVAVVALIIHYISYQRRIVSEYSV